jgi:hypothetical protein
MALPSKTQPEVVAQTGQALWLDMRIDPALSASAIAAWSHVPLNEIMQDHQSCCRCTVPEVTKSPQA